MSHGSEKRARSEHITIRLTVCERLFIDAAAERAGLTAGSFARQAILGAPAFRQVRRPPVERKELVRLLGQLGSIGGLLNQIARHMNSGMPTSKRALEDALSDLRLLRDAILKALGREP